MADLKVQELAEALDMGNLGAKAAKLGLNDTQKALISLADDVQSTGDGRLNGIATGLIGRAIGGVAKEGISIIVGHADTVQLHSFAIESAAKNDMPGFSYSEFKTGGITQRIYVDASNPETKPRYYCLPQLDEKSPFYKETKDALNETVADAQNSRDEYVNTHGQDNYDSKLNSYIESGKASQDMENLAAEHEAAYRMKREQTINGPQTQPGLGSP